MAAQTKETRAAIARRADLRVSRGAHLDHMRHGGDGLGVIDDRGTAVNADHGRKGRPDARHAPLAFQRLHQRRLLAHFIGARARVRDDLKFSLTAEDVLAQKSFDVGVSDSSFHNFEQITVLAAQIDEAQLGSNGQPGDNRAFNHRVRIVEEDQVILAGARLALVTVDQHVLRLGGLLRHKRPLQACRKSRAAPPPQVTGFHLIDNPVRALRQTLLRGFVAAEFNVAIDVIRAQTKATADNFHFIGMRDQSRHERRSLPSGL